MALTPNHALYWPGTAASIPAGWSRYSAADGLFLSGASSAEPLGTLGGAAEHFHTITVGHTHSTYDPHTHNFSANEVTAQGLARAAGVVLFAARTHSHGSAPSGAVSGYTCSTEGVGLELEPEAAIPPYIEMILIRPTGPAGMPDGAICLYGGTDTPDGTADYAAALGRFVRIAAIGVDGGATGGSDTHIHTGPDHTHTIHHGHFAATSAAASASVAANAGGSSAHLDWDTHHTIELNDVALETDPEPILFNALAGNIPASKSIRAIENVSGRTMLFDGLIAVFVADLSQLENDWELCNGANGTLDLRGYQPVIAATASDTPAGANTHAHIGTNHTHSEPGHTHTVTDTVNIQSATSGAGVTPAIYGIEPSHDTHHTWTVDSSTFDFQSNGSGSLTDSVDVRQPFLAVHFVRYRTVARVLIQGGEVRGGAIAA